MTRTLTMLGCLLLWGCASQQQATSLTLFFSPEQVSLNADQQRKIVDFLNQHPYHQLVAQVAPAELDNPFEALMQGQKRIQAVNKVTTSQNIPIHLEYAPEQTADTLILKRQSP